MIEYAILLSNGQEILFTNSTEDVEQLADRIFYKNTYKIDDVVINVRNIISVRRV